MNFMVTSYNHLIYECLYLKIYNLIHSNMKNDDNSK